VSVVVGCVDAFDRVYIGTEEQRDDYLAASSSIYTKFPKGANLMRNSSSVRGFGGGDAATATLKNSYRHAPISRLDEISRGKSENAGLMRFSTGGNFQSRVRSRSELMSRKNRENCKGLQRKRILMRL
jgi:hypothetical protein